MTNYSSYLKSNKINFDSPNDIEKEGNVSLESTPTQNQTGKSVFSTVFNTVKGYVKLSSSENAEPPKEDNSIKSKIVKCCEVERSYTAFFIFLFLGIGLVGLSFLFLPMAILAPQKFVSLFSLGCLTTISSFIFYYGTAEFLNMLFNKERRWFTVMFFVSMFLGIYLAFIKTYFILSLICSGVELFVMIVFTLSFIPGGKTGISFMFSMVTSPIKRIFNK